MLPTFRANGLVITRTASSYHVGDVVAYHNPELNAVVMHRIVAVDGDRFVMQGDNNDFRDHYHPTPADVVGKQWVYWPGAGTVLRFLQTPAVFALIVAAVVLIALRPVRRNRHRQRHGH
jgi:signal peptidase I